MAFAFLYFYPQFAQIFYMIFVFFAALAETSFSTNDEKKTQRHRDPSEIFIFKHRLNELFSPFYSGSAMLQLPNYSKYSRINNKYSQSSVFL